MRDIYLRLLSFIFLTGLSAEAFADQTDNILMIHSYSQEYPWTKSQHKGFVTAYTQGDDGHTIFSTEYLDTKRRPLDRAYGKQFFEYLQQKYQNYNPGLIYVSDDNALKFALTYLADFYPQSPIVFSGVNDFLIQSSLDKSRVTGVFEKKDIARNLEFLKEVESDLAEIVVVGDGSETYQAIEFEIKQQLHQFPSIAAQYIASNNIDTLTAELSAPSIKYVFLTTLGSMINSNGNAIPLTDTLQRISDAGPFFILSMEDAYLQKGVLGGFVTSGKRQGESAGKIARQYRQGTPVSQLAMVTQSPNTYIFNYEELQRHQLTLPKSILAQSELLNPPVSYYQQHRETINTLLVAAGVLLILALLSFSIVLTRKNRLIQSSVKQQQSLISLVNEKAFQLKQAQEIANIGSYVWDVVEDVTTWSDELYRIVGHSPEEFTPTYENYVSCIHPDDTEKFMALTHKVKENKAPYEGEYRITRPCGEVRYIHEQGDVNLDTDGQLLRLVGVVQDVTEQALHESRLTSQRDFTDTVLEVAGNIIVVLDMNGCFYRFNRAAEELTGFSREEVLGKPVWDYVIPEDQKAGVINVFENLRKGHTDIAGHYENDWLTSDGSRRMLDWRNSVLKNAAGDITHIVALGYDITERREAEEHKERLQRELNQARKMEALGQLTGGIAHDFNNMLGIITGYADLAIDSIDNVDSSTIRKYFENIGQASARASDLVRQMMVFGRNDTGSSEVLDLEKVITENIRMLRSVLPSSIRISVNSEPDLPKIVIDSVQMQQIMMNLCLNAKDAMKGVGDLDIRLGLHRKLDAECNACHQKVTGDWLELSIQDTGCGMSPEVIERIFEPFFTTKGVGEGTGMGLSVIHTIVDNYHGHILIETEQGKGTCFRLLFPPYDDSVTVEEDQLKDEKEIKQVEYFGQGSRILVVDDEQALVSIVEGMLMAAGYVCVTETDSQKALQLFRENPDGFDMLVTDQTMPGLTGIDLIKQVRKLKPGLPAILTTGYSDTINRETAEHQQVVYIGKPFARAELLQHVSVWLEEVSNA